MEYKNIVEGKFISRPNRFVGEVYLDGKIKKVHIKNTGRCKELLLPRAKVFLEDFRQNMGSRKLEFSLIGVEKKINHFLRSINEPVAGKTSPQNNSVLINIDSQVPNKVIEESLLQGNLILPGMGALSKVKRETTFENSRFDFYIEDENGKKAFIEVKGVTLEKNGVAMFPDAPTIRGIKHIKELITATENGYKAYIIFLIQLKGISLFTPNYETHKEFGDTLKLAKSKGVNILAFDSNVTFNSISLGAPIKIKL